MFNHNTLANRIASGDLTVFLNGTKYCASDAGGCGRFDSVLWKINVRTCERYSTFSLTLTNSGDKAVEVGNITLFSHSDDDITGALTKRVIYDFRNTVFNNYVVPVTAFEGRFDTCPMFLVTDGSRTILAGQMTFNCNEMHFHSQFSPDGTLNQMTCELPAASCPLLPGMSFTTDELALYNYDFFDPLDALYAWADDVFRLYHPDIPSQTYGGLTEGTMNWFGDSANTSEHKCDQQIRHAGILPKLGTRFFWISITNLLGLCPGNWLYPNAEKYPNGLRNLLDRIQAAGLVPGFWINPFAMSSSAKDFEKMKPYLIRKKDGTPAPRGTWSYAAPDENGRLPELFALDPACPEVYDYLENVFKTYASWGIRYYMIDFLEDGRYREGEQSTGYALEKYLKLLRKLKSFAAPDTHFLSATGSSLCHIGALSSSRIGLDYCEGRPLYKHWPSYPATYVIGGSLGSSGAPNRNAINNMAMWAFADGKFFRCNSNMMTVGKPIPMTEARMTASLFGISSSPVFFGDFLADLDEERLALVKKVLPRGTNMPLPVDLFTQTDVENDFVRIFRLEIAKPWGTYYVCGIFNLNDHFRSVKLSDSFLRIPVGKRYRIFDFWNEDYQGTFQGEKEVEIPAQTAVVYRLEAVKDHPWLLSTDMTVRQGDSEIERLEWNQETRTLSGTARRAPGESGNLYVISPDRFKVINSNQGVIVAKSALDMSLVIRKHLDFEGNTCNFKIEFETWEGTSSSCRIVR